MSKKGQKVLASAAILSLVMSTVAMAAPTTGTAISGSSRVDTAIAIAKQAYSKWTGSKVAVIANGADAHLVDALTVAPLAAQKQAPIFLTLGTTTLEDSVISALKAQGVTTVYVVGGTVTTDVDAQLKAAGVTAVTHLAGATRFETAKAINTELEKGGAPSAYAVVNTNASVADALSIAAEAAKQNIEIVLAADANSVPVDLTGKKVYAVGGTGVLSDALVTKLNATRLAGANRFATNAAVLQGLDASIDYTTTYVADGTDAHLVDSLPGSVLAAQTGSPIVLVSDTVAPEVTSVLTGKTSKMTTVTPLGGAVSAAAVAGVVNPVTTPTGALAVSSVAATASDTITVKFNQTPADTSKVVFTVNKGTTPLTLTAAWDGSQATLKYSSNLPMGDYTVNVKNDTTDLGTTNLTVSEEKAAKIDITTDTFAVDATGKRGYFTYKVLDQYGNDVTDKNLASITWTIPGAKEGGIDEDTEAKGVVMVDASDNFNYLTLGSTTITGYDSSENLVVTKTVKVGASIGTLSKIDLLSITNPDNATFRAGDDSIVWNVDYKAYDLAGNETSNYTLLNGGLIDNDNSDSNGEILLSSSGYVEAKMVNESGKGVIQVKLTNDDKLSTDIPVIITAITKNGSTSTLNLTLKKASQPNKFALSAPTKEVAFGDSVEIPFTCTDQDGTAITKFSDLVNSSVHTGNEYYACKDNAVTLNPMATSPTDDGFYWTKKADGSAKLNYRAEKSGTNTKTVTLSASTTTAGYSNISLTVRKAAYASSLDIASSDFTTRLTQDAIERLYHGSFTAKDQYGRAMNLTAYNDDNPVFIGARIITGQNVGTLKSLAGTTPVGGVTYTIADRDKSIFLLADSATKDVNDANDTVNKGLVTVQFALIGRTDSNNDGVVDEHDTLKVISTKTQDFKVLEQSDLSGIMIDPAAASTTLYNTYDIKGEKNGNDLVSDNWVNTYRVFGVDSSNNKVLLPAGQKIYSSVSNKYLAAIPMAVTGSASAYDGAKDFNKISIGSGQIDEDPTTTVVTVTTTIDGGIKSATATVKTTEAAPIAKGIDADDEIDSKAYSTSSKLSDAVNVEDQYGENMIGVNDWVKIYDETDPDNIKDVTGSNPLLVDIVGKTYSIVDNNGHSMSVTIK